MNRYVYADCNPANAIDPTGLWPDWMSLDCAQAAGAVVAGLATIAGIPGVG